MTVASGTRPYNYERYPFILQDDERISLSGILFEETMFVTLAERDIYAAQTGSARNSYKYFYNGTPDGYATKVGFEPRADGGNLDGSWQYPSQGYETNPLHKLAGCVNRKDYILNVRSAIEDIWDLIAENDCDYGAATLKIDYFSGIFNGQRFPNGLNAAGDVVQNDWIDREDTADWLKTDETLANSGHLYDVDLREVQYQPTLRFSKYDSSNEIPLPIWPPFCGTDGSLPRVLARDITSASPGPDNMPGLNASGYTHVNAGRFLIIGDMFDAGNTKINYYKMSDGTLATASTASCISVADRMLNEPLIRGIGSFTHGASLTSGLYRLGLYQSSPTDKLIESGFASKWPTTDLDHSDWSYWGVRYWKYDNSNDVMLTGSGLHIFNDGFWAVAGSAQALYSPINGSKMWTREADPTTETSPDGNTWGWGYTYFTGTNFASFSVKTGGTWPAFLERIEVGQNDIDGEYISYVTCQDYYRPDPISATIITDLSNHSPSYGVSLAPYTILQGHEGSDGVARFPIFNGSYVAGSIDAAGFGFAQASPHICGTIEGEAFCASALIGEEHPRYFMRNQWQMTGDVFPFPAASGGSVAASAGGHTDGPYYITYAENIMHEFEQMDNTNYSQSYRAVFIQPTGDLDLGDGSAFMQFSAKLKGETKLTQFIGRLRTATSGAQQQIQIFDYTPMTATISRCGPFT